MSSEDEPKLSVEEGEAIQSDISSVITADSFPEAVEIPGRLNAAGDVELPSFMADNEYDRERRSDRAHIGTEQQLIEGAAHAAAFLGLDNRSDGAGAARDGESGAVANKNSSPDGLVSNIVRAAVSAPFYPIKLVQVLIQLGYEASPPEQRYSFIFRQYLYYYPGIFGYTRRIIAQDGWRALYRGVGGSMFAEVVHLSAVGLIRPTVNHFVSKLPLQTVPPDTSGNVPDTEPDNVETIRGVLVRALRTFLCNTITSVAVELIVHPFHVISIRMIAQHVGRERIYNSVWSSAREIYHEEGLSGFYAGVVPALLGHLTRCVIYSSMWILFEVMAIHSPYNWAKMVIRVVIGMPLLNYLPRSYSYPLTLMSNVMAVNNARLVIGQPPYTPIFNNWRESFWHLKSIGAMYRGSVVLFPRFVSRGPPNYVPGTSF